MNADEPILALGAMSGTSMDGVDAATLRTDGKTITGFGQSGYRAYTSEEREILHAALAHWPGDPGVDAAVEVVERVHTELLAEFESDLIGFHGQTLAHEPNGRGTHQAGRGDVLAVRLGCPVVWDFRSADVNNGGQGAPLAPFFHFACARWAGLNAPVAFINLGGVGNLTWIDPAKTNPEEAGACLAFDTGPANAPIDDLMRLRLGQDCDRDGVLALAGRVSDATVERFLRNDYFATSPPKSLDRNAFPEIGQLIADLPNADAAATLVAIAAEAVARGVEHCPAIPDHVYVTGGGRNNPALMRELTNRFACPVDPVEALGLNGDMLEAQAFAFLAVRVMRGLPTSCHSTTGVATATCGGKVSGL